MRFNDRNFAILGIPDLPINAFKHIGDRKIKPQGGVSSFVDSVTGAVDDAVGSVSDALADVDDSVNETIPGGWGTVLAVTAATVGLPGLPVGTETVAGTAGAGTAAGTAGGNAGALINAGMAGSAGTGAALGTGAASTGTGLSLGGSGLGATVGGGTLGLTGGSVGAGSVGAGVGSTLGGISTGIGTGAATLGSLGLGAGSTIGSMPAANYSLTGATPSSLGVMDSLAKYGSGVLDFAKSNPSLAGSLLGALGGAIEASDAPTSQTTTTLMDPQLRAAYLGNFDTAKQTAADLQARQIAQPGAMYTGAEQQLYNLGMTPFGETDISRFYNPYQEQVVQGALGDIERTRQIQEQANMDQATRARAFGGSRQGVVSGMTNEAALRQSATTGANLRATGFNTAANLGLAARPLDIAGLQTSLGLGTARTQLEQARLDALRNLGTERLQLTSGALGIGLPNLGGSTTQPLYSSAAGSALSGGLSGAYIGSLLGKA